MKVTMGLSKHSFYNHKSLISQYHCIWSTCEFMLLWDLQSIISARLTCVRCSTSKANWHCFGIFSTSPELLGAQPYNSRKWIISNVSTTRRPLNICFIDNQTLKVLCYYYTARQNADLWCLALIYVMVTQHIHLYGWKATCPLVMHWGPSGGRSEELNKIKICNMFFSLLLSPLWVGY